MGQRCINLEFLLNIASKILRCVNAQVTSYQQFSTGQAQQMFITFVFFKNRLGYCRNYS